MQFIQKSSHNLWLATKNQKVSVAYLLLKYHPWGYLSPSILGQEHSKTGGSRGGTRRARPPTPLFWLKTKIAESRKAGGASKTLAQSRSGSANVYHGSLNSSRKAVLTSRSTNRFLLVF